MFAQAKALMLRGPVRRAATPFIRKVRMALDLWRYVDARRAVAYDDLATVDGILTDYPTARIARFLAARIDLPRTLFLVGPDATGGKLPAALNAAGFQTVPAAEAPPELPDGAGLVWMGPAFDARGYDSAAVLRERFPGRVHTIFGLLSGACLFRAAGSLVGYHQPDIDKLAGWFTNTGRGLMPGLHRLNERFPLAGARVIEFGPLDGAMTAGLFHLGAAEVAAVEIRMANAVKVLAADHTFGWPSFRLILEDMHMVDATTHGRFDLVVAHGVYYHSADPFRFLRNVASLGDAVYLGGFCAHPDRLPRPLVTLEHDGHAYRAQPYDEQPETAGAGAHPIGYYFVPEDLMLFMQRLGFESEVLELAETPPDRRAGYYLRALCRRRPKP